MTLTRIVMQQAKAGTEEAESVSHIRTVWNDRNNANEDKSIKSVLKLMQDTNGREALGTVSDKSSWV